MIGQARESGGDQRVIALNVFVTHITNTMEEPAPTFDEFMASLTSASQGEGLTVSSELYHEFFAASEEG